MSRLVIISNRLPVTIDKKNGELFFYPSAGGLATGLNSLDDSIPRIWIGWPGQDIKKEKEREAARKSLAADGLIPVFLSRKEIDLYYEGFSNKTIWPHFHYFTQYTTYDEEYWEAYLQVNRKFAEEVVKHLREDDLVWVHDYQLMLLPAMIRESFPNISIGFFLHIPFPSYEVFRILPWREELLRGVIGADQIGFHTFGYMRHFLSATYRILGYEHHFGKLSVGNRIINVDVFPMGIDYEKYAFPQEEKDPESEEVKQIRHLSESTRLILSIDRLDYTKGITQRILAFERFIIQNPEYRGKVALVMVVVPSRSNVDQYQELKHEVDTLVGRINGDFGTFDWTPIRYFYRSLDFIELVTLYQVADIAMITPLRDGMNLVAKEYIAGKEKTGRGVIILSEMAGASNELTEAVSVNPQDINGMATALREALEMPHDEQARRLKIMQEKLKKYNVSHWASTFINEQRKLMESKKYPDTRRLVKNERAQLVQAYRQAANRLVMLDYDGTLMPFHPDIRAVAPDDELVALLNDLTENEYTKIVINSGRDRQTLEGWLGDLGLDMAAEHGVWTKQNGKWECDPGMANDWKENIRTVLEGLVERTPGSFIEEKEFSIAWHYRRIDRELGEKRVREFRDILLYLTANLDLQVLEGNKVVEIKNAGINKGKAAIRWVNQSDWDFILAIGDDHTDEDTFKAMPPDAFTLKVGPHASVARYNLVSVDEVRSLLRDLASGTSAN